MDVGRDRGSRADRPDEIRAPAGRRTARGVARGAPPERVVKSHAVRIPLSFAAGPALPAARHRRPPGPAVLAGAVVSYPPGRTSVFAAESRAWLPEDHHRLTQRPEPASQPRTTAARAPRAPESGMSGSWSMARAARASGWRAWTTWALVASLVVAALLQTRLATRPGLWVDEVFSLAVATGHSLEHPAAAARPALGDFVDHPSPEPPSTLAAYATHDRPPASLRRVLRAAFLSDTSPPLYYVLLSAWTRLAGTSDAAVRLFSAGAALVCLPLLWLVGRQVADRTAGAIACVLFAFSPPALYFGSEGRMYALTWVLGLGLAWLALRMERSGARWPLLGAWAITGAAGLLTHYFFAFVWLAVAGWLWLHPGRARRSRLAVGVGLTALLVLPWYARVPESLGLWRVTAGWLNGDLTAAQMVTGPLGLLKYMLFWGAPYRDKGEVLAAALLAVLVLAMLRSGPRRWITAKPQLLWLWLLGATVGPLVFDLVLGTTASQIPRYGLAGLPAALLLVAVGTSALPRAARAAFVPLLVASWWPGIRDDVFVEPARPFHPFPQIAARLDAWHRTAPADAPDLVLVHSIPSGSVGIARYMRSDLPVASWTIRLGSRRTRDHLATLITGRCRVALVKVHHLGDPSPAERWLHEWGTLTSQEQMGLAAILYFALDGRAPHDAPAPDCAGVARARR